MVVFEVVVVVITSIIQYGMKLLTRSESSMIQALKIWKR